ncbi:hypothetical protein E4U21_001958 [Claviceps maximensis]|nr:hypothetical protein E4U21_001958 [Claviceps maximensis]
MLSKGRPLDTSSSLPSPCPSLLLPDHNSERNLGWEMQSARAEISVRTRAYPSPPTSGATSLSPSDPRELFRQSRGSSTYSNDGIKDVYVQKRPVDVRLHLPPPQAPMPPAIFPGSYQQRLTGERSNNYLAADLQPNHSSPYSLHDLHHEMKQGQSSQQFSAVAAASSRTALELSHSCVSTSANNQVVGSPKAHRKPKAHVASACVPCKKAHLRCDSQRPCSRCIGNGKEGACKDVQHKKRGRPRLRDDRDARFENMRQTNGQSRGMSPRRPVDIHPSGVYGSFDDYYQRHQPFRTVDIGGLSAARPGEPGFGSDPNGYHTPLSVTPNPPEPVAYLHMSLDFVKGSASFWDMLGLPNMAGRNLRDIVLPTELEKVMAIHSYLNSEQRGREPNYLPPILGRGFEQCVTRLGFAIEDLGRFQPILQENLVFARGAGICPRPIPIHAGLVKEGSFYFIVLLLNLPVRQVPRQQHVPSYVTNTQGGQVGSAAHPRISPGNLSAHRGAAAAAGAGAGPLDSIQVGRGDSVLVTAVKNHQEEHPSFSQSCSVPTAREYGLEHAARPQSYHAAHDRQPSEGLPRRAMLRETTPTRPCHTPPASSFQLPPIRSQLDRSALSGTQSQDGGYGERPKRLAIGGLLGDSDESLRPYDNVRR